MGLCLVLSAILVPQVAIRTRVLVCCWSSGCLTQLATLPGWDQELGTELCTPCILPCQGNPAQAGPAAWGAGAEAWAALSVPPLWAGVPHSCTATRAGLCILPCISLAPQGLSHQSWPCCHVQGAGLALPRKGPQSSVRTPRVLLSLENHAGM